MVLETPDIFGLKSFISWSLLCIYYLVHDLKHTLNTLKSYSVLTLSFPAGLLIFIIIRHIINLFLPSSSASFYLPSHYIRPPPYDKIIRLIFFSALFYLLPNCLLRQYYILRLIISSAYYIRRLTLSSISLYPATTLW